MATKKPPFKGLFHRSGSSPAKPGKKTKKTHRPRPTTGDGTVIQAGASTAGRWLVYVLIVILALGALCGFLAFSRPAAPAPQAAAPAVSTEQQQAGAFAQAYVGAWLAATKSDHAELDRYNRKASETLVGSTPVEYRDLATASIKDAPEGLTTVIISATVKSTSKEGKEETTTWTPYWYQVAVQTRDGAMAPAGLPTPVAMPATAEAPTLGYPTRVTNRDVHDTVQDFINAYLTGQGDVTRFVAPETTITAIIPAYWDTATVKALNSSQEITDAQPTNGQRAEVLVNVNLTRESTTRPAQYVLGLKVRDGRWEIDSLKSAPTLSK